MRIVKPEAQIVSERDPLKKIEFCGRTCYKSTSAMTDETAMQFYKNLVTRGHTAMLEHAALVFEVDEATYNAVKSCVFDFDRTNNGKKTASGYLHKTATKLSNMGVRYLISGNLRAINQNGNISILAAAHHANPAYTMLAMMQDDKLSDAVLDSAYNPTIAKVVELTDYNDITDNEACAHKYVTYRLTCDRGITHELVRHRAFSFAMESSRYCAYNKDKFGGQITVVAPSFWDINSEEYELWLELQQLSEAAYLQILDAGATAEEARSVLTNSLKAEIIMTGNINAWDHFFQLRYFGRTGKPHPQMLELATMIFDSFPYKEAIV